MIGRLRGAVAYIGEDHALLDVGGVGYVVFCSPRTLDALPALGEEAILHTEMLVREDILQLFGFASLLERDWHRLLTTVQGVGAKVSLGLLGTLGPEGISQAIAMGDAASVKRAPGVGPKLATRIVNELKSKAPGMLSAAATSGGKGTGTSALKAAKGSAASALDGSATADALSALSNLGYAPEEAAQAVARAAADSPDADAGALIKTALKALAPNG